MIDISKLPDHVGSGPGEPPIRQPVSKGWRDGMLMAMFLLPACGARGSDMAKGAEPVSCGTTMTAMAPDCTIERDASPEGLVLTIRHPDGSFRRLLVVKDGRGVIAADGAELARVSSAGDKQIDVAIGGMIYRLPAKVTP